MIKENKQRMNSERSLNAIANFDLGMVGNNALGYQNLKGNILCLGSSRLWQEPDISMINNIANDLAQWRIFFNLLNENYQRTKDYTDIVGLSSLFATVIRSDEHLHGLNFLFFIIFVFDEVMDNAFDLNSQLNWLKRPEIISQAVDNFEDIFEGKYKKFSDREEVPFPLYESLCNAMISFREYCVAHIEDYENKNSFFVREIINYFQSIIIQYKDEHSQISEGNYLFFRNFTSAAKPLLEHLAIINDIKLEEKIRRNLRFERFRNAAANTMAIMADLISVGKEIRENQNSNLVIVKLRNRNTDLLDAFTDTNIYLNSEIMDLINQACILRETFPLNNGLHNYISMTQNCLNNHLRWYGGAFSPYGDIKMNIDEPVSDSANPSPALLSLIKKPVNFLFGTFSKYCLTADCEPEPPKAKANVDIGLVGNEAIGKYYLKACVMLAHPDGSCPSPDISNIKDIAKEMVTLVKSFELEGKSDDFYEKVSDSIVGLTAFFAPELRFTDPGMRSLLYLLLICFIFDETMDVAVEQGLQNNALNREDINKAIKSFKDIFDGKYSEASAIAKINFPSHKNICEIIFYFINFCTKNIDNYKNINSSFVTNMKEFFSCEAAARCEFNDAKKSKMNTLFLRRVTMGGPILLEHKSILFGISIDKDIREDVMLKRFKKAAANAMAVTNDLMSLRKEINSNNNENDNIVLVSILAYNMPLLKAFMAANRFLNEEIEQVIYFGQKLTSAFPENEKLQKYILITKNAIDGHLRWYGSGVCSRYGNIKMEFETGTGL